MRLAAHLFESLNDGKVGTVAGISDDVENLKVTRADFMNALDEVKPAFGVAEEELQQVVQNGIIRFDPSVEVPCFLSFFNDNGAHQR